MLYTAKRIALIVLLLGAANSAVCKENQTWVVFGDSLTASQEWPWSDILAAETGVVVINSGTNLSTTDVAIRVIANDVLRYKPDMVFIMFGVNDQSIPNNASPDAYLVPPERYSANLDNIISKVNSLGSRIVLMTNRPLLQGPGNNYYLDRHGNKGDLYTLPRKTKDSIQLYNNIVREKAKQYNIVLIDIWQSVVDAAGSDSDEDVLKLGIDRPGEMLDGVHLGPHGARFYADTIQKSLSLVLSFPR